MFIKKGKWHEECVKGRGKEPLPQIFIVILRDAFYRLSHSFHLKKTDLPVMQQAEFLYSQEQQSPKLT